MNILERLTRCVSLWAEHTGSYPLYIRERRWICSCVATILGCSLIKEIDLGNPSQWSHLWQVSVCHSHHIRTLVYIPCIQETPDTELGMGTRIYCILNVWVNVWTYLFYLFTIILSSSLRKLSHWADVKVFFQYLLKDPQDPIYGKMCNTSNRQNVFFFPYVSPFLTDSVFGLYG